MCKVLVFAGTTEGYGIARYLSENQVFVHVCVATEYGCKSLEEGDFLTISAARLEELQMEALFRSEEPELVLDATHPYARVVTENIRTACEQTGYPYLRLLREASQREKEAVYVDSMEEAVAYLSKTEGNILVTTGSKELAAFTQLADYKNRVYARVLSLPSVAAACAGLGFEGRHLICMQGPFSQELNEAMLRQYDCHFLVTKDSGKAGGFLEKYQAALQCGAVPVIIGRPLTDQGLSYAQCKAVLQKKFGIPVKQQVSLVGIGMGARETLTIEAKDAIAQADLIIGARRMVDAVIREGQAFCYEYRSKEIGEYIEAHPEYERIAVVLSGDVGFYSGARKLLTVLPGEVTVICGISSVAYFMAKIRLSWDDAVIVSAHGQTCNLVSYIRENEKVFAILGTRTAAGELAEKLKDYGMGDVQLYVGECLSYPEEKVFVKKAADLVGYAGDPLCVVCAVNPGARAAKVTHGLPDGAFLRGKAPMTKEEIRTISLSKLQLLETSICYDVGAGTGSVSIEMALRARRGRVYAIEKKADALVLLQENKEKFAADNLEIVAGEAPGAMEGLEPPTHAFIGGSSGNLKEIMALLLKKNPHVRMVINCITLETVSEAMEAVRELELGQTEVVQAVISRSKSVGRYHMMMGENPIYVITCEKGTGEKNEAET